MYPVPRAPWTSSESTFQPLLKDRESTLQIAMITGVLGQVCLLLNSQRWSDSLTSIYWVGCSLSCFTVLTSNSPFYFAASNQLWAWKSCNLTCKSFALIVRFKHRLQYEMLRKFPTGKVNYRFYSTFCYLEAIPHLSPFYFNLPGSCLYLDS